MPAAVAPTNAAASATVFPEISWVPLAAGAAPPSFFFTMKRLAEVFAEERSKLEKQWDRGDEVSIEDLRVALQRYRAFFHRLLSI